MTPRSRRKKTYTYNDFLDRVTRVQRPAGYGDTRYVYSPPGIEPWMQAETQITGSTYVRMTTEFDGLLRAKKVFRNDPRDFNGVSSETEYDGLGRAVKVFNAHRTAPASTDGYTTTVYDGLSRPRELTTFDRNGNPTGTVDSQYDGNAVTVKDQAENPRKSITDAIGRMTSVFESDGVSTVADVETAYEYDARGNLLFVKAKQGPTIIQQRGFNYDALSRLTSANAPESGTMTYQYDQASNLTRRQDARNTVTLYTYDEMNRPLTKIYQVAGTTAATPNVRYYYDGATPEGIPGFNAGAALGRMNAVETDALGSQQETGCYYAYQTGGRLERMVELVDGKQFTSRATYNEASLPLTLEYPSLATVRMAYNPVGQAERIERQKGSTTRTLSNNLLYTAPGGLEQQQYGNNLFHKMTYNSRQQVETITLGTGTVGTAAEDRLKLAYTYGTTANNGNVLSVASTPGAGAPTFTQNFGYDRLNRLTSATEAVNSTQSWTQGYTYDRFGNRFQVTGLGAHNIAISEQNNRITEVGYLYDGAGNLRLEPGGKSYEYDAENRIVTATVGGAVSRYEYDGEGKRLKKITPSETVRFVYGANGELIAEYHGETVVETQPTKEYVYGASGLLCEIELACNGRAAYKYTTPDHLGTPRIVTNHNGGVLSRHDYLPFGEDIAPTLGNRTAITGYAQPDRIRKKFTGYERDDETGLDFAQARHYANTMGRFMSPDPYNIVLDYQTDINKSKSNEKFNSYLNNPQRWNLFSYGLNNPLKFIDLDGRDVTVFYRTSRNGELTDFGHVFIYVRNDETGESVYLDYYIEKGNTVLGLVDDPRLSKHSSLTITTDAKQEQAILDAIKNLYENGPPNFESGVVEVFANCQSNCTTMTANLLRAGGIDAENFTPRDLWESLVFQYGYTFKDQSNWGGKWIIGDHSREALRAPKPQHEYGLVPGLPWSESQKGIMGVTKADKHAFKNHQPHKYKDGAYVAQ